MFPPRRRGRRALRIVAGALVALLIVVLLAVGSVVVLFDPNSLKPRIIAAVKRETGRDVTINGRIGFAPSLRPVFRVSDISLANIPGGSSPTMMTVAQVEAQVALLPLISNHLVITRLVVLQPHVLLERNAQGVPNWEFHRDTPTTAAPPGAAPAPPARRAMVVTIQGLHARDIEIRAQGLAGPVPVLVTLPRIEASSASVASPVEARADVSVNGVDLTATLVAGSLARLQDRAATTPWPLNLTVEGTGLRVALAGQTTRPLEGRGYSATVEAVLGDDNPFRATLDTMLPLRELRLNASVADTPDGALSLTKMAVRGVGTNGSRQNAAGSNVVDPNAAGAVRDFRVASFVLGAEDMNQPVAADVRGTFRDGPFVVTGTLVSPNGMFAARLGGSFPLDLVAQYADAQFHAKGAIGSYPTLSGVDVGVDATVPDLITLSKPFRVLLPSVRNVALTGRLTDADGTLFRGAALKGFKLTAPNNDLSGDVQSIYAGRPSLRATLTSQHLDLSGFAEAVRAAFAAANDTASAPLPDKAAASGAASPPATGLPAPAGPPAATPDLTAAQPEARLAFSDRPLQLGFIRRNDLDVLVNFADLHGGGLAYTDVVGHVFARNGEFSIDPLTARLPVGKPDGGKPDGGKPDGGKPDGGKLDARVVINAAAAVPTITAELRAPGMAIAPMMAAFGLPDDDAGAADINVSLRGTGATPHDLAASADGTVALATGDAEIDNRLLSKLLGDALRRARLPDSFGTGRTRLRCLAVKADLAQGNVKVPTLVLDASNFQLQGTGEANLGDERLSLRVRPVMKVGGQGVAVPLRIGGTLTAPKASVDALAAIAGFGERERGGDPCAAALAAARPGTGASPANAPSAGAPQANAPSGTAPRPAASRGSRG